MPGIAASTRLTCVFGSAPKVVEAPEKSFDAVAVIWAWTSRPTTTSHSPVSPSILKEALMCGVSAKDQSGTARKFVASG
jgi:hypothetical protein